jgi:hypothetical protein
MDKNVVKIILSQLDVESLVKFRHVCKQWKDLIDGILSKRSLNVQVIQPYAFEFGEWPSAIVYGFTTQRNQPIWESPTKVNKKKGNIFALKINALLAFEFPLGGVRPRSWTERGSTFE